MNHEEFETAGDTPSELPELSPSEFSEEARTRALFRQSVPRGEPMDLEALSLRAAGGGPRRSSWRFSRKGLVAAALLLLSGAAVGWLAAREEVRAEAREEMLRLESSMSARFHTLRFEVVNELSGALSRYSEDLLDAQQDGMKKVAILLRNDYRPRLARLRSRVEGLALAMERPVRLPVRDR